MPTPDYDKFELVDRNGLPDHQAIHALVDSLQEAATRLLVTGPAEGEQMHRAGADTTAALAALLRGLSAHLDDEEDLIVPIVLDHTEAQLGLG